MDQKWVIFGIFWLEIWHIWYEHPPIFIIAKITKNQKCLNLEEKKKCLIWVFWGWKLKTILSYLKQTHSNLSNCRILWKNKNPKFGTKNALFRYFRARNLKIFIILEI